jgi:hypothetical protein
MLSDNLKALASRFEGWSLTGGVHLDAPACAILSSTLGAAADDVAQIEALPVPLAARGDNLVSIEDARRQREIRAAGGDWGAA